MSEDRTPMADLVAALVSLSDPRKDGKVSAGQRQYRYLELPDLLAEVRHKFGEHGWAVMQIPDVFDGHVTVTNLWLHRSGVKLTHPPFTLPAGRTPQDIGSAITYARRYSLAALVGLAGSDDDDAQAAQRAARETPELTRPITRTQAKAGDPDPWHTPKPPPRPAAMSQPDIGAPSTRTQASKKQTGLMWVRLKDSGMTLDEIRPWVQAVLALDTPDWHTDQLTSAQVSAVIDQLQRDTPPPDQP